MGGEAEGIRRELEILRGAIDNTNEGFVTIDSSHRIVFFNKTAERFFGYSREEVIGRDLNDLLTPDCSQNHRRAVDRYIATRKGRRIASHTEIQVPRKNGETFPADISFSVSEQNAEIYFTGILRDLTQSKAMEEKISRAERLAALGQVVAEITHEIKNPLMVIGGLTRQSMRSVEDEKVAEKLGIVSREVERVEKLLRELRDLYVPKPLETELLDLNDLLEEVVDSFEADTRRRGIQIHMEPSPSPLMIRADRDRLKEVFLNLLFNAAEAIESDGEIHIRSASRENQAEVSVTDDGGGISEQDQEQIFTPFFSTKPEGSGLGLNISRRIIEEHPGGRLDLQSEAGKETTVTVTLPAAGRETIRRGTEA